MASWKDKAVPVADWKKKAIPLDGAAGAVGDAVRGAGKPAEATFDNMLANFFQGLTFGYGDEIVAGGRDLFGIEDYDSALAGHRGMVAEGQEASPAGAFAANLAGGILVPGFGASKALQAGTTLGKVGGLAAAGGLAGGLTGFGSGEGGFESRLGDAVVGAGVGAVAAPALVGLANAGKKGVDAFLDVTGLGSAARAEALASRKILQTLERAGLSPDDAAAELARMRGTGADAAALVDLGEMPRRLTAAAARVPGKGAETAADFVEARQLGQGDRVSSVIDDLFGTNKSAFSLVDDLNKTQKAASKPLYQAADPVPLPLGQAVDIGPPGDPRMVSLNDLMQFDDFKNALQRGIRVTTLEEGAPKIVWDPKSGVIPTRMVDLVKKGLDADIAAAMRNDPVMARALIKFKNQLLAVTDQLNPKYGEARAVWAGAMELEDAVKAGQEIISQRMDPEALASLYAGLSPSQQPAFRVGVVDALKKIIGEGGDGRNKVLALFGSPAARARLETVLGPANYAKLAEFMGVEKAMFKAGTEIAGNSKTAVRGRDDADFASDPMQLLGSLRPKNWAQALGRKLTGYTEGMNEKTAASVVSRMTEMEPGKLAAIIKTLEDFRLQDLKRAGNPLRSGATYGVGLGGVAVPGLLSGN